MTDSDLEAMVLNRVVPKDQAVVTVDISRVGSGSGLGLGFELDWGFWGCVRVDWEFDCSGSSEKTDLKKSIEGDLRIC